MTELNPRENQLFSSQLHTIIYPTRHDIEATEPYFIRYYPHYWFTSSMWLLLFPHAQSMP